MPNDSSLYVRKAVVFAWRNWAPLVALVPKERIYPPQSPPNPERPFAKYSVPITDPFVASGMDGASVAFVGKAFAETTATGADTVSGEELAHRMADAMVRALADPLDLVPRGCPFPATAHVTWEQTQVIQDRAEADRFHALVACRADVVS